PPRLTSCDACRGAASASRPRSPARARPRCKAAAAVRNAAAARLLQSRSPCGSPETKDRFRCDRGARRWFLAYEDLRRRSFLTELTPLTLRAAASARSAMSLLSTKPESCTTPL